MTNIKISILIPVYKVEPYLQRCIDSVLAQDFTDWEMILVDDGSPDNCPQICDENVAKDARIKVVHKKNGGLVSARLEGWKKAKAEYIINLDSDDYLLPQALSSLYDKAIEGNYDIVKGSNLRVLNDGTSSVETPTLPRHEVIGEENYLFALLSYHILPYLWGGIYRKSLFSEKIFQSVLHISIGEDWITNQSIWRGVKKYAIIDDVVCAYYINTDSMMQQRVLSHAYHESFGKMMLSATYGSSIRIKQTIERDRMINHIRCFFMPEIGWDGKWYDIISEYTKKDYNLKELQQNSDKKFLKFIKSKIGFYLYSFCYRKLFYLIKLHGKERRVL